MLKAILTRMIAAGERDLGVPAPFAYFLRDVAPNRLMRFSFIKWVEGTRRVTPAAVRVMPAENGTSMVLPFGN